MTTFAIALAADVKKNRGIVLEALMKLSRELSDALRAGNMGAAQGKCAEMFVMLPAILTADAFLAHGLSVDLADDPAAASKLLGPMVMMALNTGASVTEGRSSDIAALAYRCQVESLSECTRNMLHLRDDYESRVAGGQPVDYAIAALFHSDPQPAAKVALRPEACQ